MDQRALQELVDWECYGCGKLSESGLQIKSYWSGDELICDWRPKPFHAGHPGKLHHGIMATICFCHGAWAATSAAHRAEGREIHNPIDYCYLNQSLLFDIVSPIPIDSTVTFRARVATLNGEEATVSTGVFVAGMQCARAETSLVRASADEFPL
jgi:hypothetical protein